MTRTADKKYRATRLKVLKDDPNCWLCGEPIDMTLKFPEPMSPSVDHIIPHALGGTNERSNLRSAHLDCNRRRQTKDVDRVIALNPSREW